MGNEGSFQSEEKNTHSLNPKTVREVLEISSTGYGLESVMKPTDENKKEAKNNHSCGGL